MGKMFNIFRRKSQSISEVSNDAPIASVAPQYRAAAVDALRAAMQSIGHRADYGGIDNGITLFLDMAEVFFPIDFIASRIAGAHFEIKRVSDDSLVWCTGRSAKAQKIARILSRPNCMQTWAEFVYMHFVSRLASGNAFVRAAMSDTLKPDTPKWDWCNSIWSIPAPLVSINPYGGGRVPLFGIAEAEDIIRDYTVAGVQRVPAWQIWHDRDGMANFGFDADGFLLASSRLRECRRNIGTLKKVYDARNIIYGRCGALGLITNKTKDVTGPIAMKPDEKKELLKQYHQSYGVQSGQSPIMISDMDLGYQQIGLSIAQLQPFEETLLDAIVIAGQFGIPDVLVPRKDHSTFNNQAAAEKGVYTGVVIPMANRFCQEITEFLGIEQAGYYISCNFDGVDCLQSGLKKAEEVKTLVNARCSTQFANGLISINDWRAQIHESAFEAEVFSKTKFEMTDEELQFISRVITTPNINLNPQQENGTEDAKSDSSDEGQ